MGMDLQAIMAKYDSLSPAPSGTMGTRTILEYNLGSYSWNSGNYHQHH